MNKVFIGILVSIFCCSCNSQNLQGDIEVKQIESNYPIIIGGNTSENMIYQISFPLVYNIKKDISTDIQLYTADYNEGGKYNYEKGSWSRRALIHVLNEQNQLEITKHNDERELLSKYVMREYVFYTSHTPDTSQHVRAIFKPYLEKMKRLGKDTLHIESIQQLKKMNPDLLEGFLAGDSICIKYTKEEKRKLGNFFLPVEIK